MITQAGQTGPCYHHSSNFQMCFHERVVIRIWKYFPHCLLSVVQVFLSLKGETYPSSYWGLNPGPSTYGRQHCLATNWAALSYPPTCQDKNLGL